MGPTISHRVFEGNSSFNVSLIAIFRDFFANINKILILAARIGFKAIILWRFETFLIFLNLLIFPKF